MERKNEAQLDKSRNLIDVSAKKESGFYIMTFTKQLLTDDEVHDVNLGRSDKDHSFHLSKRTPALINLGKCTNIMAVLVVDNLDLLL